MRNIKNSFWVLLAGLGLLWPSCVAQPTGLVQSNAYDRTLSTLLNPEEVPVLSVDQLYQLGTENVILLDTRAREEYEVSHIPGAIWVGYEDFDAERVANLDRQKEVIVYCSVGYRSEKVGGQLQDLGFEHVQNLYGSIFEWANQSYPLVSPSGDTIRQIHAYNRVWGRWMTNEKVEKKY
jgi:rhodanese-related sulfurtransferase